MGGEQRFSDGGALVSAKPKPIACDQPHPIIGGLAPHVEQLRAGTQTVLAVFPDLYKVLGIGIGQGVALCHTRDIVTIVRSGQGFVGCSGDRQSTSRRGH